MLCPLFGVEPNIAAKQVAQYARHNALLGFNATILYERGTYLPILVHDHATRKLLHSGDLQVLYMNLQTFSFAVGIMLPEITTDHGMGPWVCQGSTMEDTDGGDRVGGYIRVRQV